MPSAIASEDESSSPSCWPLRLFLERLTRSVRCGRVSERSRRCGTYLIAVIDAEADDHANKKLNLLFDAAIEVYATQPALWNQLGAYTRSHLRLAYKERACCGREIRRVTRVALREIGDRGWCEVSQTVAVSLDLWARDRRKFRGEREVVSLYTRESYSRELVLAHCADAESRRRRILAKLALRFCEETQLPNDSSRLPGIAQVYRFILSIWSRELRVYVDVPPETLESWLRRPGVYGGFLDELKKCHRSRERLAVVDERRRPLPSTPPRVARSRRWKATLLLCLGVILGNSFNRRRSPW
ncbi:hypothetical protein CYMTET_3240 [Cymbomonas tetramitiformis]|uniref:Uncharacterized protein n=1 Tax=Cymbomonas tetramitiformis TaxID=36881 RepID=A0AAE0H5I0_9CHLO|nr:hypothetical protein CYMTET_3240 [Cymbomonas tetramitiformis]